MLKALSRRDFIKGMAVGGAALGSASLLTACGSSSSSSSEGTSSEDTSDSESSSSESAEEVTEKVVEKPETISWWTHDGLSKDNGAEEWFEEFENFTGIHLDHSFISNNEYYTKLELAFASGEVPECFDLNGANLAVYASQGALYDLTDLLMASDLYDKVDPSIWESIAIDGRIYAIPKEVPSAEVTYVRGDWLDELGMDDPTNYDEFIDMLRTFNEEIGACTIPYTAPGLTSSMAMPEFYQDAHYDFTKVDGKWIDGFAQDNMAEAMQRMQDAYAEGLIDMEIITNTTSTCRDSWYEGKVGVFTYWSGKWGGTLQERLVANNEGAIAHPIEPIEEATYYYSTLSGLCISANVSDEKAEQIFKYFIEYMHDGGEGQVLFQSGVEGVHWEQDGEYISPLPNLADSTTLTTSVWITPWLAISDLEVEDKKTAMSDEVANSLAITDAVAVQQPITPVSETYNKISSDLTLEKSNILAKVVMGEMSVEDGVASYAEVAEELNVAQVLAELNGEA